MKIFSISLILLAASAAALTVRQRRDVSELAPPNYDYLPPHTRLALPDDEAITTTEAVTETPTDQPSPTEIPASARGASGYEYRAVRRLKYRHRARRDVSHLQPQPHQRYLPPPPPTTQDIVENLDDGEVVAAPVPKAADEYLQPVDENEHETPATGAADVAPETEASELEVTEAPKESAVLAADGYHYRQPESPMEIVAQPKSAEYLPPLAEGVVEAEGPEGETAVLADDGYHYRAVKRLSF